MKRFGSSAFVDPLLAFDFDPKFALLVVAAMMFAVIKFGFGWIRWVEVNKREKEPGEEEGNIETREERRDKRREWEGEKEEEMKGWGEVEKE